MRGFANVVSACQLKHEVRELNATLVPPKNGNWRAGFLLHHKDNTDYTVAFVNGASLSIEHREGTRWNTIQSVPVSTDKDGNWTLKAFRKGGKTYVSIGTETFGPWEIKGGRFGFAIDNCDARFHEVRWKK